MTTDHVGYKNRDATLDDFVSSDPPMQACLERARLAAHTNLPVLILGESGTGKTILARAIHNSSGRAGGPFVSFNAAALSETLLDSQLFGHERGAFTGAQARVKGKFELADRGTLFLDEIADLSPQGQSKILRAIEYGEFERLGSETLRDTDVRVLSATHYPLAALTDGRGFRADLLFRINGVTVMLPPLRARPQDLRTLVASEIARASHIQGKSIVGLDRAAADRLFAYQWPGNLRELSKVVHAAVALTTGSVIADDALLLADDLEPPREATVLQADGIPGRPASLLLKDAIHAHIRCVMQHAQGNKRRAARELGIGRETLERKLREMEAGAPAGPFQAGLTSRPLDLPGLSSRPASRRDGEVRARHGREVGG
jgi:transcriptional regulator with PAS, ATPase and Fis domain